MSISAAKITRKQKTYAKSSYFVQPSHSVYLAVYVSEPNCLDRKSLHKQLSPWSDCSFVCVIYKQNNQYVSYKILSEYDQEIPQSQTAD